MIVALGTSDREPHERLASVFSHSFRILIDGVIVCCAVLKSFAARRNDFPGELIPRRVLLNVTTDPGVICFDAVGSKQIAIEHQQIGPTVGPIVNILWGFKQ